MLRMTSELNCQLLISSSTWCLNLINPVTPHKDYPDQDFTKLKHSGALSRTTWSGQSHLDLQTNFANTRLYPEIFHHCIRNIDSPALKHSELLANYRGDLRSEGYLYLYLSRATLDSKVLHS